MGGDARATLEALLFHEARLLDERRFEEWLTLLTDDVIYWVPSGEEQAAPGEGTIVYEGMQALKARVARSLHNLNPAQLPPPRTQHFITNVTVATDGDDAATVMASLLLYVSKNDRLSHHPGRSEHWLRRVAGEWRIRRKKVFLIDNDLPLTAIPLF
jgi:3-phenylpropionate/cinnamic acid dioxygenase small subunit